MKKLVIGYLCFILVATFCVVIGVNHQKSVEVANEKEQQQNEEKCSNCGVKLEDEFYVNDKGEKMCSRCKNIFDEKEESSNEDDEQTEDNSGYQYEQEDNSGYQDEQTEDNSGYQYEQEDNSVNNIYNGKSREEILNKFVQLLQESCNLDYRVAYDKDVKNNDVIDIYIKTEYTYDELKAIKDTITRNEFVSLMKSEYNATGLPSQISRYEQELYNYGIGGWYFRLHATYNESLSKDIAFYTTSNGWIVLY